MNIYLDNAATTKTYKEVNAAITDVLTNNWGNPSSKHILGFNAEKCIRHAAENIANVLGVNAKEIIFTSCATEANNMAIFGAAEKKARKGKHIITSAIEHSSVKEPFIELERRGYDVTFIPVDNLGKVDVEKLKSSLTEETTLVSIMSVNNEIGTVQPIEEIGKIVKEYNKDIIFHTDAVQAFGKVDINIKSSHIDMLSVSAHKFHGPKGIGFLYKKDGVQINPLIYGGGQQKGMRSGTECVPLICGMDAAVTKTFDNDAKSRIAKERELRDFFISELLKMDSVIVNGGKKEDMAPHVISATFEGVRAEVLLHSLEDEGIYVSSGSACSSNRPGISSVLEAIGLKKDLLDSTIRFSLSEEITKENIEYAISVLNKLLPFLRQFKRK